MARNGSHISLALMQSAARIMMSHLPSLWRDLDSYLSLAMRDVVKNFIHFFALSMVFWLFEAKQDFEHNYFL